jgi:hypothetical protein
MTSSSAAMMLRSSSGTSETPPDPTSATVTAEETGCCDAFHETGNSDPETTQAPIALVAGKKYAFLAFVKEGGGGDYVQVAMRKVGDPTPAGSLRPISGTLLGANAKPTKGEQITKQPVLPPKMEEGQSWSLSVDGIVTPAGYNYPVLVQWQKNGADIPGANGKTYTIKAVTPTDAGTYRAVLSAPSGKSTNSTELTGVVIPDTAPTLAIAQKSFSSDQSCCNFLRICFCCECQHGGQLQDRQWHHGQRRRDHFQPTNRRIDHLGDRQGIEESIDGEWSGGLVQEHYRGQFVHRDWVPKRNLSCDGGPE